MYLKLDVSLLFVSVPKFWAQSCGQPFGIGAAFNGAFSLDLFEAKVNAALVISQASRICVAQLRTFDLFARSALA